MPEPWTCPKCEARRGAVVRSSLVGLATDPIYDENDDLQIRTLTWVCLSCLIAGRMTVAGRTERIDAPVKVAKGLRSKPARV